MSCVHTLHQDTEVLYRWEGGRGGDNTSRLDLLDYIGIVNLSDRECVVKRKYTYVFD